MAGFLEAEGTGQANKWLFGKPLEVLQQKITPDQHACFCGVCWAKKKVFALNNVKLKNRQEI